MQLNAQQHQTIRMRKKSCSFLVFFFHSLFDSVAPFCVRMGTKDNVINNSNCIINASQHQITVCVLFVNMAKVHKSSILWRNKSIDTAHEKLNVFYFERIAYTRLSA